MNMALLFLIAVYGPLLLIYCVAMVVTADDRRKVRELGYSSMTIMDVIRMYPTARRVADIHVSRSPKPLETKV